MQQRLATREGFASYREIHQWLEQEHEVKVAYRTVHQLVRYTLKAKLKVPRPQSPKASVAAQDTFKKNYLIS
jgi:transposase